MLQYFDPKKDINPNKDYGTPAVGGYSANKETSAE